MSKLTVYKASAGSGKTYTLTLRYLELLFRNEFAYRNILAVTFTNKAASEMKSRIMLMLFKLASYKPAGDKKPDYLEHLSQKYHLTEEAVSARAAKILNYILNDYSRFSVGTIDKFFQMVIRAFTREIGLQAGYNLELNNSRVLNEAVDNLLYSMDENNDLREWLIQFAEEKIRDGKSLDLKTDLMFLGKEVFKESFRNLYRSTDDIYLSPERIRLYQNELSKEINVYRNNLMRISKQAFELIKSSGLEPDDFSSKKSGALGFFYKIMNTGLGDQKRFIPIAKPLQAIDNPDAWFTKGSAKKDTIIAAFHGGLNALLKEAIDYADRNFERYRTAREIHKYIFAYGILADLSTKIREITSENNLFLLSDSSEFLNEIIDDNEAPFIYEKAGNFFQHFMLDEFQDTSVFQWNNFKPLVLNGLASNNESLVVGDVKQSIYRWRNSDWKILAGEVEKSFQRFYEPEYLPENFRSSENIIRFNNSIFSVAPVLLRDHFLGKLINLKSGESLVPLAGLITGAYSKSGQQIPSKSLESGGFVNISFIEKENKQDYYEKIQEKLPRTIIDLQNRGYHAGDIAILVRTGDEGKQAANILLSFKNKNSEESEKFNLNVISNDSLFIAANPAVMLLIALLKSMRNPADLLNEAFIKHEYLRYLVEGVGLPDDFHHIFSGDTEKYSLRFSEIQTQLISQHDSLRHQSLFELIERLTDIFGLNLNHQDVPYIQAFQDIVLNFMKKDASDINSFLDYWEENGVKETLSISEQQDAIRIFTIHKAKGLEFKVVILPFFNWGLEPKTTQDNILWCKTEGTPFHSIPFVALKYGSGLSQTLFANEYYLEMLHNFVDNLNLSYVAFTRAIDELHVFMSPKEKITDIGDLLYSALTHKELMTENSPLMKVENSSLDSENGFTYGLPKPYQSNVSAEISETEVFRDYPIAEFPKNIKIKYRSEGLFNGGAKSGSGIDYGIIMHNILSRIRYPDDLEKSVNTEFIAGTIDDDRRREFFKLLDEKLKFPAAQFIFDKEWTVLTEREILSGEGMEYRPDRVMINGDKVVIVDYKFGEHEDRSYLRQLKNYTKLLREMGYREVRSYIWYVILDKWEEAAYDV